MGLDHRSIEAVAADLEAIASLLGSLHETLANRITNNANLLRQSGLSKREIDPTGLDDHPSVADQFWTNTNLNKRTSNKHGCPNEPGQVWTVVHQASDRGTAVRVRTGTSNEYSQTHQNEQTTAKKLTNDSYNHRLQTDRMTSPHVTPSANGNKQCDRLRSRIPVLTERQNKTITLTVNESKPSTEGRPLHGSKEDTKPMRRDTKLITNRFGASAPLIDLKPNTLTKPKEPIRMRIVAAEKINGKTIYKSTLITNKESELTRTATIQAEVELNQKLDKETRSNYYKSIGNSKNFSSIKNFPEFNVGKKLINPSDLSRLKRMATLNLEEPEDYLKLHEVIKNSDHLKNGTMNIEKITCSRLGKATVVCENEIQKELLKGILELHDFHPNDVKIKNNSFAIFGISKTKETDAIIKELVKRDKRFKINEFKMKERFPINTSKDAITFSCCESLTARIISKPYTFLGTSRYKLNKFADLVQCYKCAKFGHTMAKCDSKKTCCPNCAETHTLDKCTTNYTPKCGNCSSVKVGQSNHSSWDVRCPYRLLWIRKQKEWLEATLP